jgi:glutamate synthase domain-containing protein 1
MSHRGAESADNVTGDGAGIKRFDCDRIDDDRRQTVWQRYQALAMNNSATILWTRFIKSFQWVRIHRLNGYP